MKESPQGDKVILRQCPSNDRKVLAGWARPRAVFVDGEEIIWGYEAPRDGIREAINKAIENI